MLRVASLAEGFYAHLGDADHLLPVYVLKRHGFANKLMRAVTKESDLSILHK